MTRARPLRASEAPHDPRGWWAYLSARARSSVIGTAGGRRLGADVDRARHDDFQRVARRQAGFAALLAVILGITIVTTEFRHGTITPTFLADSAPRAGRRGEGVAAASSGLVLRAAALAGGRRGRAPWFASSTRRRCTSTADVSSAAGRVAARVRALGAHRRRDRRDRPQPGRRARRHARLDLPRRDALWWPLRPLDIDGSGRYLPGPRARRSPAAGRRRSALVRAGGRRLARLDRAARRRRHRSHHAAATSPDATLRRWPRR